MPGTDLDGLDRAFDSPDSKRTFVRRLFSVIADRYDLITVLLSYGQDRRWKRRLASLAGANPSTRVLDLACGTGDITLEMATATRYVVGLDVTDRMLQIARGKPIPDGHRIGYVAADMMDLPFPDSSFGIVTTGYGLRNVPDLPAALVEIGRVLEPGGLLLSLDFNRPANRTVLTIYLAYLSAVGSALGYVLHGQPAAYRYIPESIRRYPGAEAVCGLARQAGFTSCVYHPVLGGLMAIHSARK